MTLTLQCGESQEKNAGVRGTKIFYLGSKFACFFLEEGIIFILLAYLFLLQKETLYLSAKVIHCTDTFEKSARQRSYCVKLEGMGNCERSRENH